MTEKMKIVTTIRGDSLSNKISMESPLGRAIMGHRVGDKVTVKVDDGYSYVVEIKEIDNTADEASDTISSY